MNKNIRMDALKAAGIDTNSFISITGIKPGDTISFTLDENGNMNMSMTDAVVSNIMSNGYVKNTKLYRRWIAAQTLRILWNVEHNSRGYSSYDDYVKKNYKYMYQFKFMENEIKVLAELAKADKECFEERVHFFDRHNIVSIYADYVNVLNKVTSRNYYDRKASIIQSYTTLVTNIYRMSYSDIYNHVRQLNKMLIDLSTVYDIRVRNLCEFSRTWLDTFKGEGAYYTLKNLVLFHGLSIYESNRQGSFGYMYTYDPSTTHKGKDAFEYIKSKLDDYKYEGWRFMAMLKKCLADNNFDVTQLY